MLKCSYCTGINPDDALTCKHCGTNLIKEPGKKAEGKKDDQNLNMVAEILGYLFVIPFVGFWFFGTTGAMVGLLFGSIATYATYYNKKSAG